MYTISQINRIFSIFLVFTVSTDPCTIGDADLNERGFYDVLPHSVVSQRDDATGAYHARGLMICALLFLPVGKYSMAPHRSLTDDDADDSARTWSVFGFACPWTWCTSHAGHTLDDAPL